MKYVKMGKYAFNPDFVRVFIVSAKKAYAEFNGADLPPDCTEITAEEFEAVAVEYADEPPVSEDIESEGSETK